MATNETKFKTAEERLKEFKKFCRKHTCDKCPVNGDDLLEAECAFNWLNLEYKE